MMPWKKSKLALNFWDLLLKRRRARVRYWTNSLKRLLVKNIFINLGSTIPVLMVLFLMGQSGHQKVEFTQRLIFRLTSIRESSFHILIPVNINLWVMPKQPIHLTASYVILRHLTASYVILRESKYLRGDSKSNCSKEEREAATKDLHSDLKWFSGRNIDVLWGTLCIHLLYGPPVVKTPMTLVSWNAALFYPTSAGHKCLSKPFFSHHFAHINICGVCQPHHRQ